MLLENNKDDPLLVRDKGVGVGDCFVVWKY
jgi:hypothetical protein